MMNPLFLSCARDLPGQKVLSPSYGDGVQNASPGLQALLGSNRTVIITPGTYLLKTTVGGTGYTDLTIILMAGAVLKHDASLVGKAIQFNNPTRVRVTSNGKGTIDVSSAPNSQTGQANDAIYMPGQVDCEIDHVRFFAGNAYATAGGDSHVFMSGNDGKVHHNTFVGAFDIAVYVSGTAPASSNTLGGLDVYANTFINCNGGCGSKRGFYGLNFHDNIFEGGNNGVFSGETESNPTGKRCRVYSNTFRNMTGLPVIPRTTFGWDVHDNDYINCTGPTMIALQGASKCKIHDNIGYIDPSVYTSPSSQAFVRLSSRLQKPLEANSTEITFTCDDNEISRNLCDGFYTGYREDDASQNRNRFDLNIAYNATVQELIQGNKSFSNNATVRRLQGVASGYAGTELVEYQVAVTTTGATTLNVLTVPIASSRILSLEVWAVANSSGVAGYDTRKQITLRRQSGGNITRVGSADKVLWENNDYSPTSPNFYFFVDTTAQAARGRIDSLSGTTMYWLFTIRQIVLATSA